MEEGLAKIRTWTTGLMTRVLTITPRALYIIQGKGINYIVKKHK